MDDPIPISAKVPCSASGLLTFSWGLGTELRFCEIQNPGSGDGGNNPFKSTVVWSAPSPSHKVLAHAVASAQEELVLMQDRGRQTATSTHEAIAPELLSFCKRVRHTLAKERAVEEGNLIALEHAIWGLLEVFFIDASRSGGFIAEDLSAWLADNGAVIDDMMNRTSLQSRLDVLLSSPRPDVLEDYWPCLSHLVSLGRIKDALRLMDVHDVMLGHIGATHPSMMPQYEILDSLYVLLRQMPRFRRGRGDEVATGREFDNMAEFLHYRSQWQLQCRQLPSQCSELFDGCKAVNPKTESGVRSALAVMGGDDEATLSVLAGGNWLELLISELVHIRPNAQARQHLIELVRHCQTVLPPDSAGEGTEVLSLVSNLIEAMVDLEVQRVVEVLSSSGAVSPWFMAHMYEVMRGAEGAGGPRTSEVIGRPLVLFGGDQVEYWRLLFAEMLACQPSTAKLALSYLSWCPTHGADAAEILLESLPVSEDAPSGLGQVHRLLHMAESHGLGASSSTAIRRAAGAAAWYQGRVGDAAAWMLRAHDDRRLATVLEPAILELSELLGAGIGTYTFSSLSLASADELEALLAALCPIKPTEANRPQELSRPLASRDVRKQQPHVAVESSSVKLLGGFLQLQRAARVVAALDDKSPQADQDAVLAAHAVRDAIMGLVHGGSVPRGLTLTLLFHVIPFLEAPVLAFSPNDMQTLVRWLVDYQIAEESSGHAECVGLHVRHVKDVQLALTRALARSSVYAN